jgi:hypothetical protein
VPHPPRTRWLVAVVVGFSLVIIGGAVASPDAATADVHAFAQAGPAEDLPAHRDVPVPASEHVDAVQLADGRQALPGDVLVGFRQTSEAVGSAVRQRMGLLHGGRAPQLVRSLNSHLDLNTVPADVPLEQVLSEYRSDPDVAFAEPDVLRPIQDVPNDTILPYQWNLLPLRATSGWSVTHGSTSIRVAMVDTGIFDEGSKYLAPDGKPGHPDLRGKVDLRHDFTASDPNQQDPDDWMGHGTHTAGIVAAAANNALGIAGVGFVTRVPPQRRSDSTCERRIRSAQKLAPGARQAERLGRKRPCRRR